MRRKQARASHWASGCSGPTYRGGLAVCYFVEYPSMTSFLTGSVVQTNGVYMCVGSRNVFYIYNCTHDIFTSALYIPKNLTSFQSTHGTVACEPEETCEKTQTRQRCPVLEAGGKLMQSNKSTKSALDWTRFQLG